VLVASWSNIRDTARGIIPEVSAAIEIDGRLLVAEDNEEDDIEEEVVDDEEEEFPSTSPASAGPSIVYVFPVPVCP
jgi:hypothetical protein